MYLALFLRASRVRSVGARRSGARGVSRRRIERNADDGRVRRGARAARAARGRARWPGSPAHRLPRSPRRSAGLRAASGRCHVARGGGRWCAGHGDEPLFNAGTGANVRLDGVTVECDAAVADDTGDFGAVMGCGVRHPVLVAAPCARRHTCCRRRRGQSDRRSAGSGGGRRTDVARPGEAPAGARREAAGGSVGRDLEL